MHSPALESALAAVDTVFDGFTSPGETGCGRCHLPEQTAYLRTPNTRVPPDVLEMYVFEVADHFHDHAAVMRRLLPQGARALADGTLGPVGWRNHGLSEVDWRLWPAEQAAAVEAFVSAWWEEVLATPEPPHPVEDVFQACSAVLGSFAPLLDRWGSGPVADAHLLRCVEQWLDDLLSDRSPFLFGNAWDTDVRELQSWLAHEAPARLESRDYGLATRAGALALPCPERRDRLY
ncbi:hypothetical protein ACFS5L_13970 [Streptomyces phyllanthi]|uniref:Uncharacterized protein n=1 Tax=Streptomyces phyllanthi TaxID=1803180 RepID=A0A5N8W6S0_9ACTN|nr:hypothetical protein [Streptomyces phyllanthi]MPY42596.1 hypothetical protein [Streptomyces phyllanthi]